ncbi:MAG: glycoside hydrolase [Chlorobi bacterium]|nr:glycoside hydrolase [Chlorobiota bacterium]MCI0717161.1 glycoside hydrolase [Chlorobiota bacterium]
MKTIKTLIITVLITLITISSFSQTTIMNGTEPIITSRGNYMLLFSNNENILSNQLRVRYSTNQGTNWINPNITLGTSERYVDPAVAIDKFNNFVLIFIKFDGSGNRYISCKRSSNFGQTWSNVIDITNPSMQGQNFVDKVGAATDNNGNIYCAWVNFITLSEPYSTAIYSSKSTDGGNSWSTPITIPFLRGDGFCMSPDIAASSNGSIHIVCSYKNSYDPYETTQLQYATSFDAGSSWSLSSVKIIANVFGIEDSILPQNFKVNSHPRIAINNNLPSGEGGEISFPIYVTYSEKQSASSTL